MRDPVMCDGPMLRDFATRVLVAIGVPDDAAADMAGQIVGSELAGHESHGLRRLSEYVARARSGDADPSARGRVQDDHGSLVRIDGERGFGHVVVRGATRVAIERAKRYGIAAVAVRNSEYAGRLFDFCDEAAAQGVATLFFVNDSGAGQVAAPTGGLAPRLSTNPIAAGIPRAQPPHLVLDMATTAVANGRVSEWRDRGEVIPPEWANDHGVLQFMAGPKGFGLALVAEALAGALSGAGTVSSDPGPEHQGVFLIAIDVAKLRPLDDFTAEIERFGAYIKDVPLAPGATPIRFPGEVSAATTQERLRDGVPVQPFTWDALLRLADDYQLEPPTPQ